MEEKRLNIEAPLPSVRRSVASSQKTLDKKHILLYPKSDSSIQQLAEPVTVPFNWENILGRSKPKEPPPVTPSPTLSKETEVERKGTKGNDDDGDDDDAYSDALDTIMSPPQSVLMNCSVSGISGLELDNSKTNKSGTFHTDQKIRDDFMMNRFLPAAKAMTLEATEYASSRKQVSVVVEQAREINRSFREEKKLLLKNYISDIIQSSNQYETEEESEDDKYNSANVSARKGCGLISQLRFKNSLCLLNPVPGMKMRNIVPMASAFEVAKPNKGSHVVKKAIEAIYKNKSGSEAASMDTREVRKKWISQSCRFTHNSGESQQQDRLSPFRRSRTAASGVSPCRSRPQHPLRGAKLLCDFKEAENICQSSKYLNFQSRNRGSNEENKTVEKTLYIDSASTVKLSSSSSSHSFSPESSHGGKEPQALEEKNMLDSHTNKKAIVVAAGDSSESVLCPVPPPLPKSPSESWLWRALPLVSVRNPLHHSNLSNHSQSVNQDSHTTFSNNTKWETTVKTSNLHDDHVRYSQEITTHKSQRLKI